jgi:2Fe-2S ferredoxin
MKIIVTLPDASRHEVDAKPGASLMQTMRDAGLPVRAECGGAMACATCHVKVDAAWLEKTGRAIGEEADLLNASDYRGNTSRLGCQVGLRPGLEGLSVALQPDACE